VLDCFVRLPDAPSSGSGWAWPRQGLADLHGATLRLDASPQLGGLRVQVVFPLISG
jgi:two-component system OmpR family sensor kinase